MQRFLAALCAAVLGLGPRASTALQAVAPQYAPVGRIQGPAGIVAWDYATIDPQRNQLFLATLSSTAGDRYAGEITAFDLKAGFVLPTRIKVGMPHKVVILDHGRIAVADAASNSVDLFDEVTGHVWARIATGASPHRRGWHNPDSLALDPATGLLIAVNHDGGVLVLVDVAQQKVAGRVRVGGILEEATAADNGTLLVNVASQGQIAVASIPKRRVLRRIALRGCEEPTGIAYDSADRLAISVCSNGLAKFIDPTSGLDLASIRVGKGADGIMYDALRNAVLIAGGESGTLSVIWVRSRRDIRVVQTLEIPPGTRLGAVDPASGRVYLPTARHDMSGAPLRLPGIPPIPRVVAGTFGLLVIAPSSAK